MISVLIGATRPAYLRGEITGSWKLNRREMFLNTCKDVSEANRRLSVQMLVRYNNFGNGCTFDRVGRMERESVRERTLCTCRMEKDRVELTILDKLIRSYGDTPSCKTNIEGFELQVLKRLLRIVNASLFESNWPHRTR